MSPFISKWKKMHQDLIEQLIAKVRVSNWRDAVRSYKKRGTPITIFQNEWINALRKEANILQNILIFPLTILPLFSLIGTR